MNFPSNPDDSTILAPPARLSLVRWLYSVAVGIPRRDRRALLTAATSVLARLVALAVALAAVRLTINYLGASRYGLWMTVTSITAFLAFSDFGVGNALINRMSAAFSSGDRVNSPREVSSAVTLLGAVGAAVLVIGAGLLTILPWARIYNVSGLAAAEAGPATFALIACFALVLPLGLVQKIQLGFQDGAVSNIWAVVGSVLSLALLLVCLAMRLGLPWVVLAMAGGPVIALVLNWIQEFGFSRPWIRPRRDLVDLRTGIGLARTGLLFLGLQLAAAVAFSTDNIIAAQLLGPVAVAQYSVTQRVFMAVPALVSVAAVSLWPAFGEAVVHSDRGWIRRTLVRSSLYAVGLTAVGSLVILAASRPVFSFLIGPALVPSLALTIGFSVWAVLYAFGSVVSMLLNAANVLVFQLITASLMAATSIALKIELGRSFGVAGIIWGTVIAYSLLSVLPILIYLRHRRRIDW
jgi:O-antigen/teichoic acid export membrane protein